MAAPWTLHGIWASGPTYKVALMLSMTATPHDFVVVTPRGTAKEPPYLAINPFGQVPALVDNLSGRAWRQSASILEILAERTGRFGGTGAEERCRMREWMYWDFDRLAPPIYRLRGQRIGVRQMNQATAEMYYAEGLAALGVLEQALADRDWLVGDAPSIADIDVYGVLDYAEAGGFELARFPRVAAYARRVQALPGFGRPTDLIPKESRSA